MKKLRRKWDEIIFDGVLLCMESLFFILRLHVNKNKVDRSAFHINVKMFEYFRNLVF